MHNERLLLRIHAKLMVLLKIESLLWRTQSGLQALSLFQKGHKWVFRRQSLILMHRGAIGVVVVVLDNLHWFQCFRRILQMWRQTLLRLLRLLVLLVRGEILMLQPSIAAEKLFGGLWGSEGRVWSHMQRIDIWTQPNWDCRVFSCRLRVDRTTKQRMQLVRRRLLLRERTLIVGLLLESHQLLKGRRVGCLCGSSQRWI